MDQAMEEHRKKAFAKPNDEVIRWMVQFSPIVEIGAGTGYWAKLLTEAGAEVIPYDIAPVGLGGNKYKQMTEDYGNVNVGGSEVVEQYSDHTLFLCWPPYSDPMAYDCLTRYQGDRLIYIGEGRGGCTGGDMFFEELENWTEHECPVDVESFSGLRDHLFMFTRS